MRAVSRRAFLASAAAFTAWLAWGPSFAFADDGDRTAADAAAKETSAYKQQQADEARAKLVGLQAQLESASENYYAALDQQKAAQDAMDAEKVKIDEATGKIEKLQTRLGNRAATMYRDGPIGTLDFLLSTATFEQFADNWDLLNRLNGDDAALIEETRDLRTQLQDAYDEYARQEQVAEEKTQEAEDIKNDVEQRLIEAQQLAAQLDAEAQALLEAESAAAAAAIEQANWVPVYRSSGEADDHSEVVNFARTKLGCPYIWAAAGPDSFDCSGLVVWAYRQIGIELPHYTESLYAAAKNVVPISQAKPGDVLYRYGHVGIAEAAGGVPYIHAPTFNAYVRDTDPISWAGFTCALQF